MSQNYNSGRNRKYSAPHKRHNNSARKPSSIPASRFINHAVAPEQETPYQPTHSFSDFGLNDRTVSTLKYIGYEKPSAIQDQCLPYALAGRDIIGLANTGTGKTAAFLLPIIDRIATDRKICSALILAPTRELAQQIDDEFRKFSSGQKLYSALVVGGSNIGRQINQVERGPHIVIGTPGRVKDLIKRGVLRLQGVKTFVLDEADRMCDMGFVNDIRMIESELPRERQTFCYSATMTDKVKDIVADFMRDPITVTVIKNQTNNHIEQGVIYAHDREDKKEKLIELLRQPEFEKVIIFGETKFGVQRLSDHLTKNDLLSEAIHGNKSQSQRNRALKTFKDNNNTNILVATDVAARGIDVKDVTHVINFDPPKQYEDYVHRIGRTGRAGSTGNALTFVIKD